MSKNNTGEAILLLGLIYFALNYWYVMGEWGQVIIVVLGIVALSSWSEHRFYFSEKKRKEMIEAEYQAKLELTKAKTEYYRALTTSKDPKSPPPE